MLKLIATLSSLLFLFPAWGLETDNYLMWKRELKDSTETINGFLANEIRAGVETSNKKSKPQSCIEVTNEVAHRFKSYFVDKNPLENWLKEHLKDEEIYPRNGRYTDISIYRDPYRFYVSAFGLSPNVQINGVYLGTDKLTHFSSTGRRYFTHYLKKINEGLSDVEAQKSAIRFGLKNESGVLGYWSSGVFSYGDVESNYQGFLFYKRLCFDKTATYLARGPQGKWSLKTLPNIRDYISPYMDETFNISYRLPKNWGKVAKVLKEEFCPLVSTPRVARRMEYYKRFPHRSFSLDYVHELQQLRYGDAPTPEEHQSFDELCKN